MISYNQSGPIYVPVKLVRVSFRFLANPKEVKKGVKRDIPSHISKKVLLVLKTHIQKVFDFYFDLHFFLSRELRSKQSYFLNLQLYKFFCVFIRF